LLANNPLTHLSVDVATGGTVNWGSPTTVTESNLTLDTAGTLNTASLSNLTSTSLTATNGATFSFPALVTYATDSSGSATFTATKANSILSLPALTTVNENGWNLSLVAQSGGVVDLHKLSSITNNGSVFDGIGITSSNTNSVVNLSSLDTTADLSNSITITDNGSVLLGAGVGTRYLSFQADFANADGPLDVLVNGVLADAIQPNNLNTNESYQFPISSPLVNPDTIDFVSSGSNSSVTVSNYIAVVPEPVSLDIVLIAGLMLCCGRRSRKGAKQCISR
jgi:hypothetical protein